MPRKEDDLTMMQRASLLVDELYRELDQCTEARQFLRARCESLEQLCKDAAHLMETAPLGAITNSAGELDWFARYDAWKQLLEQEVK